MVQKLDFWVSLFLVALSVAMFWESLSLPPAFYDPLGPAAVPRALALFIGILSVIVLVRATRRTSGSAGEAADPPTHRPRATLALILYGLTLCYVLILALGVLRFGIATFLFLLIFMGIMTGFDRRRIPVILAIALVTGFGCQYLFTQVLIIDLP